ncbi:cholecystokinin receptor type A-like [Saccostrea echinata]|uniref:cholecystokinin receptor type A-like n=1 Tax=Saccostrea echinata TaxID=191078 RepID=UPI002A82AC04|nr:cholecystokinin receptor type A-like [Saccostrea echinata]
MNFSSVLALNSTSSMIDYRNLSSWNNSYEEMTTYFQNGSSNNRPVPKWSPPPLTTTGYIVIPVYILIFCVAVVGNVLVILTLIQNKRMRTVTNVLLLNLAISDLLLAVFCMPFTVIPMLLKNFIFGEPVCIMIRYLQGVSIAVSCFTLVALSLERYFAICRPLKSRSWQTLSHSYKTIIVCWILALGVIMPVPIYIKYREYPQHGAATCREEWPDHDQEIAYSIILPILLLAIPLIIMSLAYGMISITLWSGIKLDEKSEKEVRNGAAKTVDEETSSFLRTDDTSSSNGTPIFATKIFKTRDTLRPNGKSCRIKLGGGIRQTNGDKSRASKKRVIKMLFALVFEFFLCLTPFYIIHTWMIVHPRSAYKHLTAEFVMFINLLAYVSTCCNPVTYCFMNRNFRQGFVSVFRCIYKKRKKSDTSFYVNGGSTMSRTHLSRVPSYDKMQQEMGDM